MVAAQGLVDRALQRSKQTLPLWLYLRICVADQAASLVAKVPVKT